MLNLDELNLVIEDAQEQVDLHTRKVKKIIHRILPSVHKDVLDSGVDAMIAASSYHAQVTILKQAMEEFAKVEVTEITKD